MSSGTISARLRSSILQNLSWPRQGNALSINPTPDDPALTLRALLKDHTHSLHAELDDEMSRTDLASEHGYGRFLLMHARILPALENRLAEVFDGKNGKINFEVSRRASSLYGDLDRLGIKHPAPLNIARIESEAEAAGYLYVTEGSRLGARMIAKRLSGTGLPDSFLNQGSAQPWRDFIQWLDTKSWSLADKEGACRAAARLFTTYLACARMPAF